MRHPSAINLPALRELVERRPELAGIGLADLAQEVTA